MHEKIQLLFEETKQVFEKSQIKKFAERNNFSWYYSISSTRLTANNNVIVGFNGGAAKNEKYKPQESIPKDNFKDLFDKKWLGSLQRIYEPLKSSLPQEY